MSEREKMLAGEPYDPLDPDLVAGRELAQSTVIRFNNEPDAECRAELLAGLLGSMGERSYVAPPLFCDYGANIQVGADCFVNAGAVILDCAAIRLGDRALLGPGVQLLAADHPREPELRLKDVEFSRPVTVGRNCWIGAGAIVCPGVTIGDHSVIGAGSIVVGDIPERVVAVGNPCRVIREL